MITCQKKQASKSSFSVGKQTHLFISFNSIIQLFILLTDFVYLKDNMETESSYLLAHLPDAPSHWNQAKARNWKLNPGIHYERQRHN